MRAGARVLKEIGNGRCGRKCLCVSRKLVPSREARRPQGSTAEGLRRNCVGVGRRDIARGRLRAARPATLHSRSEPRRSRRAQSRLRDGESGTYWRRRRAPSGRARLSPSRRALAQFLSNLVSVSGPNFSTFPAVIVGTEYSISPVFDEAASVSFARLSQARARGTIQAVFAYCSIENDIRAGFSRHASDVDTSLAAPIKSLLEQGARAFAFTVRNRL